MTRLTVLAIVLMTIAIWISYPMVAHPADLTAAEIASQKPLIAPQTWQSRYSELPIDLQETGLCESDMNKDGEPDPEAKNKHSTASGVFQIINGTFAWVWTEIYDTPVDWTKKNDPMIQMDMAEWLYAKYHLKQWQYPCGSLYTK